MPSAVKHIAIFANTRSGKGRGQRVAAALGKELRSRNISFSLCIEQWPAALPHATDIWIVGGDGTLNYFLNQYPHITQPVCLFKGGTGNDLFSVIYGNISLQQAISTALRGKLQTVDAVRCNGELFVNAGGFGFDGSVARHMQFVRRVGGLTGYFFAVVRSLATYREPGYMIRFNDQIISGRFLLVMVNNSGRTGGGFWVSPHSDLQDGIIELLLVQPLPFWKRLRYLPLILKGRHLELPFVQVIRGTQFEITCSQTVPVQLDGEYREGDSFSISVLPGYLLLRR